MTLEVVMMAANECDADSVAMIAEHINVFGAPISSRDAFAETKISDENRNASETDSVFNQRCTWIPILGTF